MFNFHKIVSTFASGSGRALDIGAGRGEDSYYLAKMGFEVDAVDSKSEGMIHEKSEILSASEMTAKKENLPIHVYEIDIRDFPLQKYSLIIAINSLQFLKDDLPQMAKKITDAMLPGGRLILSIVTNMAKIGEKGKESFITEEYIKELFNSLAVVHSKTHIVEDGPHPGVDFPHTHTVVEFVGDKK